MYVKVHITVTNGMDRTKMIIHMMIKLDIDVLVAPELTTPWKKQLQGECKRIGKNICGTFTCIGTSSDEQVV
eukprot:12838799-Ditylum_brightwellii.AAC.1